MLLMSNTCQVDNLNTFDVGSSIAKIELSWRTLIFVIFMWPNLLQQNFAVLVFHEFGSTSGFQKYPHVRISQLEAAV
jgi:hypothetical protein